MPIIAQDDHADSVMVALYPPGDVLQSLVLDNGEPIDSMHITIAYLGKTEGLDRDVLESTVQEFAAQQHAIKLKVSGLGVFNTEEDGRALVALIDSPDITQFYLDLTAKLEDQGLPVSHTHGFTPHCTLQYLQDGEALPIENVETQEWTQDTVSVSWGSEDTDYDLASSSGGGEVEEATLPRVPNLIAALRKRLLRLAYRDVGGPFDESTWEPAKYNEFIVGRFRPQEFVRKVKNVEVPISNMGYHAAYLDPEGTVVALTAHSALGDYEDNYAKGWIRLVVPPEDANLNTYHSKFGFSTDKDQVPTKQQRKSLSAIMNEMGYPSVMWDRWPAETMTYDSPTTLEADLITQELTKQTAGKLAGHDNPSSARYADDMRPGGEQRGNSEDRANRKRWMLRTFGDGETCPCTHCGTRLDYHHLESDRIVPGGSYTHSNVQPSCRACNLRRSNDPDWKYEPVQQESPAFNAHVAELLSPVRVSAWAR